MHELSVLRRAAPDVPPPSVDDIARARARLHEAISIEEQASERTHPGRTSATSRSSRVVFAPPRDPAALPTDASWRRSPSRWRTLVALAALVMGALWVGVAVQDTTPPLPVIGELDTPTPTLPRPDELGHHPVDSRRVTLWDGQRVPAIVSVPTVPGPWPQVILLPHEFARNEWSTFPQLHVEAMVPVAELLASAGLTVITVGPVEARASIEAFDRGPANLRCAVAYARSGRLGDPARVVIFGQGQSGYDALAAVAAEVPVRPGCRATGGALPDAVVSVSGTYDLTAPWFVGEWPGDAGSLDERRLDSILSIDTGVSILFVDPPVEDALDLVGDTLRTGALLRAVGFETSLAEIEGLGRTAWAVGHEPTREVTRLVAQVAYAPDAPWGRPLPPPLVEEPPQRDGLPLDP